MPTSRPPTDDPLARLEPLTETFELMARELEELAALDAVARPVQDAVRSRLTNATVRDALTGRWLGHAVHPVLTDVVLGTWTSATVLDLVGGADSSASARRLIGTGLLVVGPTAWTGWAEWSRVGQRDKRVGLVHAVTNAVAIGVYTASWIARRRDRHRTGARLALAGAAVSAVGAYLGGHLTEARNVASHHPAYDEPPTRVQA